MRHPYAIFFESMWQDPPRRAPRDDDHRGSRRRPRWPLRRRRRELTPAGRRAE